MRPRTATIGSTVVSPKRSVPNSPDIDGRGALTPPLRKTSLFDSFRPRSKSDATRKLSHRRVPIVSLFTVPILAAGWAKEKQPHEKITFIFQSQLVQGHSHSRLNASPLREVSAKVEADAASSIQDRQIILSPAELMKSNRSSNPKCQSQSPASYSKQNSPVPDLGLESAVTKVMNIFRGRSASSAAAEDKKRLLQWVSSP